MSEMHLKSVSSLNSVGCSYVGFQALLWKLAFCLGMVEFDGCGTQKLLSEVENNGDEVENNGDEVENDADGGFVKRKKLSLPKGRKRVALSPSTRFNVTVSDCDIEKLSKGCIPTNTTRSTGWALQMFQQWVTLRNKRSKDVYPSDFIWTSPTLQIDCVAACSILYQKLGEQMVRNIPLRLCIRC